MTKKARKPKLIRTNVIHDRSYLASVYGAVVDGEVFRSPAGEWRREKDGRYRFWREGD